MIRVTSTGHVFNPLQDGAALPPLDAALKSVCREHFRRVDRFIQLALLGSGLCATGHRLAADCGLYMGSGLGPMANNIATQEQLIRDKELPKPFNFINTLGNSAGYYVARNLELHGQNQFVSRRGANFEAVLMAAWMDLHMGLVRQALVGVVEEATPPFAEHRRRQGLAEGRPVAEGSHWLLLEVDAASGRSLELRHLATPVELDGALQAARRQGVATLPEYAGAFHDSVTGALAIGCLQADGGSLLLMDGDADRGWDLFHFGT